MRILINLIHRLQHLLHLLIAAVKLNFHFIHQSFRLLCMVINRIDIL